MFGGYGRTGRREQTMAPLEMRLEGKDSEGAEKRAFFVATWTRLCYIHADFVAELSSFGLGWPANRRFETRERAETFERVDVSEPASVSAGIAARYATAVFEMANEIDAVALVETDLDALSAARNESNDLNELISSPVYTRRQLGDAIGGLAKAMDLTSLMTNTLGLMAANRRLFVLPHLITALRNLIAEQKGEVTADVTSAKELSAAQVDKLAQALKASVGKDVKINAAVNEDLIGGLIVKVGSKMIDTSIRSKLANLQNAMKEAG